MQQLMLNPIGCCRKRICRNAAMGFWRPMPVLDSLLGSLRGCGIGKRRHEHDYGMGDIGMAASRCSSCKAVVSGASAQLEEGTALNCAALRYRKIPPTTHPRHARSAAGAATSGVRETSSNSGKSTAASTCSPAGGRALIALDGTNITVRGRSLPALLDAGQRQWRNRVLSQHAGGHAGGTRAR